MAAQHLERTALIYIRQSTMAQVREHTESTARQYALAEEAARLGWPATAIEVIDADLGVSGRSVEGRDGFKGLVARVCLGEIGAIFGLEVSRLARSSADLSRLLEYARLTDTLVIDADGVYDLTEFNDRLLLGLKGTMSEAELHLLAGRLQGAKRAAAERGELRTPLPIGYVYDDEGQVVIDPDEEVTTAIADVFTAFTATGSAYQVVAAFADRRFPRRAYGGAWAGRVQFGRLTHSRVLGILANPVYAGAYVFGRFRSRRLVNPDGSVRTVTTEQPRAEWGVCIHDHHEAYISWEQFLANEAKLAANRTNAGARPPREGSALCQGIVFCGSCGRAMSTRYAGGQPYYECARARADHVATPDCRSVRSSTVDEAVAAALLAAVGPEQLALALAAADEVTARRTRSQRAAELTVERARYAAERAERAHAACEPENRLVARSLETRWEARLVELAEAEAALAAAAATQPPLPPADELAAAVADLPALWSAPTTSDRDRKRVLRTLLGDITLRPGPTPHQLRVGLRWNSGATEELIVTRMRPVTESRRAAPEAVALARELGPRLTNPELAAALNAAGHRTGTGKPFDRTAACNLRYAYRIGSPDLLADGELTPRAVAERLGVAVGVVHGWLSAGTLPGRRSPTGRWCIPFPPDLEAACRARVAASPHLHRDADGVDRHPGELSIAEVAAHLMVNTDVVYYWAERGYLPTRRGKGGRRWLAFTADTEAACRTRIADSYKLPEDVKAAHFTEGTAV
ncbi:recombinase family protein [Amycolatopsis sp.]|uniref:recombinase family protein n=1 Tax=Amycolatopsis sp. TaxID=37632 RepID=UPI002D80BF5D|nr:recombinase family protein [Amycolatopsis sp.]HET6710292.1 recombinase family protein [Amycolatopsis sp.]